jgi:hypothetical protein
MSTALRWVQEAFVGGRVRWDVSNTEGERYLLEGRVVSLDARRVVIRQKRRIYWSAEHGRMIFENIPNGRNETVKRSYFNAPFEDRIEEAAGFWTELAGINVSALQLHEAYAEKMRAALTRREPAIREFFDIDHAVRSDLFDHRDRSILDLLAAKLLVDGNEHVNLSEAKILVIGGQVETQLRPVLRERDYEAFDLQRVIAILEEVVRYYQAS